eukprot:6182255-Pleurochrysis_carterae.AAC.1
MTSFLASLATRRPKGPDLAVNSLTPCEIICSVGPGGIPATGPTPAAAPAQPAPAAHPVKSGTR